MMNEVLISDQSVSEFVSGANELQKKDHVEWQNFINSHKFLYGDMPSASPLSDEYFNYQYQLWKKISGRESYDVAECEQNLYVPEAANIQATYPFTSRSSAEVGNYFFGAANIFRHLNLPPDSNVVEFGVGYGHVTRMLANFGYNVVAVDIEKRFLDLLAQLALPGAVPIETQNSSFSEARFAAESVDAFVFFECFHHCIDHAFLLENLRNALKLGGKIVFAAEPFYDDWFPFPWGVRLDGHAVWAIRSFGWMELGFRKSYITDLLERLGFAMEWSSIPQLGAYGEMMVATRTA